MASGCGEGLGVMNDPMRKRVAGTRAFGRAAKKLLRKLK
jgi:hypothetical protein